MGIGDFPQARRGMIDLPPRLVGGRPTREIAPYPIEMGNEVPASRLQQMKVWSWRDPEVKRGIPTKFVL